MFPVAGITENLNIPPSTKVGQAFHSGFSHGPDKYSRRKSKMTAYCRFNR